MDIDFRYFMQTYVSEFISFLTPVTLFFNCITYLNQIIHNNYCQLIDASIKTSLWHFIYYIHVEYKYLNYLNGTPNAETNSMAIYSCRTGNETDIELRGDNKRVCIKGFWSGSQPKCLKKGTDLHNSSDYQRFIISMLVSFLIGASFIGLIVFLVMKYVVNVRHRRAELSIPSVVVSEPNHYYERNAYEEYRYESIRMNALEFLELERINSLYQSNNG
ncbi:unnamed protein product [Oppiella nova]|uniref:Sushi domain-containing protein n=1 Tax=Oppiella nova TaxID=334625 RepID=A0A7R9QCD9_9ACAR|nr:unnamed protein product [Oppiella nova]CAG2162426.1 unnamed protein product [Oppiella nova]